MRIKNKELRRRRHRKEQAIKEAVRTAKGAAKSPKPASQAKPAAAKKPPAKKPAAAKKPVAKKKETAPAEESKAKD